MASLVLLVFFLFWIKNYKYVLHRNKIYDIIIPVQKNIFWKHDKTSNDSKEDTPVPIPNTEVKLFHADNSVSEDR